MRLEAVHQQYKDRADFYLIYIREAHASDSHRPARHVDIPQPTTFDEREKVAQGCSGELELTMPFLVDDMSDTAAKAYNAMPDRLFILAPDGTVAYRGDRGPRGFDVESMATRLKALLAPK